MTPFNQYQVGQPHVQQPMQPPPSPQDPLVYTPIYPPESAEQGKRSTLADLVASALMIFAVVLGFWNRNEARACLASIKSIGPGHTFDEQVLGLATVGIIAISILAAVKIFASNNQNRRDR